MVMTRDEVCSRAYDCFAKGLCFVSLKPLDLGPVKAITHPDVPHSLPVLVLKEYVHIEVK